MATRHSTHVCKAPRATDADWVVPGPQVGRGSSVPESLVEQKEGRSSASDNEDSNNAHNAHNIAISD